MVVHFRSMVAGAALAGLGAGGFLVIDHATPRASVQSGEDYLIDITPHNECRVSPAMHTSDGWSPMRGLSTISGAQTGVVLLYPKAVASTSASDPFDKTLWQAPPDPLLALTDAAPVQDLCNTSHSMAGGYILLDAQGQVDTDPPLAGFNMSAVATAKMVSQGSPPPF